MRKLATTFFTCFFCTVIGLPLMAQTLVKGIITDAKTGEPLIGATVSTGNSGTSTDVDGSYELALSPGQHELTARYVGFSEATQSIDLEPNKTIELNFQLDEAASLLQTATVSSSRFEKPLGEVTVSLEVLQPQLIESAGKVTLDDALQKVPGVTIIDGQANIRGGSGYSQGAGSRVLLLVDDIPILQADAGYPNWEDIPVENIEQVEVIKGAASALYGSSALNGVVNVRTAYAKSTPVTKASVFGTAYLSPKRDTLNWWDGEEQPYLAGASLSHRRKMGKVDFVVGGFYLREDSYRQEAYRRQGRLNFNVRHRANERLSYGLGGNFNTRERASYFFWAGYDNAYVGNATTYSSGKNFRFNIDPFLTYYDKNGNRHRLQGRFYRVNNDNDRNQSNSSNMYYGEYQFQRRFERSGLELSTGLVISGTAVTAELYGDTTFTSQNMAAYAQLDKRFGERLNMTLGVREEYNQLNNPGFSYDFMGEQIVDPSKETESRPVFRIGANYRMGQATYLRASWGQGYRYPSIAERYIFTNAGFFIVPNPSLGSETGWSAEFGLKQGLKLGNFLGFFDASAYYMRYNDMIEFNWVGAGFRSINIGDTEISGLELTLAGKGDVAGLPLQLLAGYTYINPQFSDFDLNADPATVAYQNAANSSSTDNVLKYRFRHSFKADAELSIRRFRVGAESFYLSSMEAIDGIFNLLVPGLKTFQDNNADGFWYHNFRVAYVPNDDFRLSLFLGNAFNKEYALRPALLEAPRNLGLRMDASF